MSIPKEPRQIMINLMYLVLTALLALNVSNEILQAFRTLSISIDKSNEAIDVRNKETYNSIIINEAAPGQAAKVHPFRLKADSVVAAANAMVAYFEQWKKRVVVEAGGYSKEDPKFPDRLDNIDATTLLLVEHKGGDSMKRKINDLRSYFLAEVNNPKDIAPLMPLRVDTPQKNDHNPTGDWSIANFEHMPAVASLALFSKFENDVRSSEALVVKRLLEEAHLTDVKFDTIGAVAIPKQSYVLEGDKVEASILLAAFNKSQHPTIVITGGGGSTKSAVDGVIPWETIAHGTGLQTVRGRIELETEDKAHPISKEWDFKYMVGTTGSSMQLDKMNVFYIGVANPVTVTAAGYSVEDVSIEVPGGEARADSQGRKAHYNVWVTKPGTVDVAIKAKSKDAGGAPKTVGTMTVRVKRIPDPVAKLSGTRGGPMPASTFRLQIAPNADMGSFEFNAKFIITSFTFSIQPRGKDYQGPYKVESNTGCRLQGPGANPQIEKWMNNVKIGDRIYIEEIKAVGPDGTKRDLGSLNFTMTGG